MLASRVAGRCCSAGSSATSIRVRLLSISGRLYHGVGHGGMMLASRVARRCCSAGSSAICFLADRTAREGVNPTIW